ncbi:hypothetical protein GCM10011317_15710 [Niveispirillum cyanobacteriorum]|nr:hypothetical protein GCM10011317_15710 [Niveispirillum cyanobacteriorum]
MHLASEFALRAALYRGLGLDGWHGQQACEQGKAGKGQAGHPFGAPKAAGSSVQIDKRHRCCKPAPFTRVSPHGWR